MATLPAFAFGRPLGDLTLRLAYVDIDGAPAPPVAGHLSEPADIDGDVLSYDCLNVMQGIEAACAWFKELK